MRWYEDADVLRPEFAGDGAFARRALSILDSRLGGYRGYGVVGAAILPATLELDSGLGVPSLRLRVGAQAGALVGAGIGAGAGRAPGADGGVRTGVDAALTVDAVIEADSRAGLRLTGLGPGPLLLRRGSVDTFRCATFVFGVGDIDGDEPTEEFGLCVRPDAGLACAYAYGTLRDPYEPRWGVFLRPASAVPHDDALPASASVGWIASRCLDP